MTLVPSSPCLAIKEKTLCLWPMLVIEDDLMRGKRLAGLLHCPARGVKKTTEAPGAFLITGTW